MTISKTTMLFIVFGLIILAAIAYLVFGKSNISAAVSVAPGAKSEAEVTFTNLIAEIDPLTFDTSILTDVRFKNLVDIHTPVAPEASGRKDPFAPFFSPAR